MHARGRGRVVNSIGSTQGHSILLYGNKANEISLCLRKQHLNACTWTCLRRAPRKKTLVHNLLFAEHFSGGLRRNWRYIPPCALLICWGVAVPALWIIFALDGSKAVKAKLLWAAIATSVLGVPLLAGSFYWCRNALKKYDASMARTHLEGGGAVNAEPLEKGDETDNEARTPLLQNASPPGARAEESC